MKTGLLILSLLLYNSHPLTSQDIPGLSYCLLFDSNLEKQAFRQSHENDCDPLIFLLAYDSRIDSTRYIQVKYELSAYAEQLRAKRKKFRQESKFLHYVFYDVHNRYLKSFNQSETFNGIFNERSYNCVSGTALYACLLTQLGYAPQIFETRYHVFLLMDLEDSTQILFEATDPLQGFVYKDEKIDNHIQHYLAGEQELMSNRLVLSAPFNDSTIFQNLSLKELAGLHYYNLSVHYNNNENYYDAFRALKKANILYPESERIHDFLWFILDKYDSELLNAFVHN